jgi:hypothetical protein
VNAARTAAIAAQAVRFGQAKRPTRIPKAHPPTLIETDFAAAMVAMVAEWRALAQPLIDDYNRRTDDTRRARTKLNTVRAAVQSSIRRAPTVAERSAKRTVQHSKAQVARQTKAALGIEVPTFPPGIDKRVEGFIQENAAAVQRLGNATVDQMEATLARAFTEGWSDAEVAEELIRRFAMTEKHATRTRSNTASCSRTRVAARRRSSPATRSTVVAGRSRCSRRSRPQYARSPARDAGGKSTT